MSVVEKRGQEVDRRVNIFDERKENKILVMVYITLLSAVLASYFFLVSMRMNGYNQDVYAKAYMYFMLFSFLLFSVFLPFWEIEGAGTEKYAKMLAGILVFTISTVPHILTIIILGKLNMVNFSMPILIQALWGIALLCLKDCLAAFKILEQWKGFILSTFIFIVLIGMPVFLYFFVEHSRTVITTVFDRRIPVYFFFNPLLTQAGVLNAQTGGPVQSGYMPYPYCMLFWTVFSCINILLSIKMFKRKEGEGIEAER